MVKTFWTYSPHQKSAHLANLLYVQEVLSDFYGILTLCIWTRPLGHTEQSHHLRNKSLCSIPLGYSLPHGTRFGNPVLTCDASSHHGFYIRWLLI